MKLVVCIALLLSMEICFARSYSTPANTIYPADYDVSDVITETVLLRPSGLLATIAGTAVFLGTMPLSLFASIAPPHDAIDKAAKTLVIGPANATFKRPFAYYHYNPVGIYPKVINH